MNKKSFTDKLNREIVTLKKTQDVLQRKSPSYDFLDPTINNAIASMVDLLIYIRGKNTYYKEFSEKFFDYRHTAMNRAFIGNLHTDIEMGLREIISEKEFSVIQHRKKQVESIVARIKKKLKDTSTISREFNKILKLGGNLPTFKDYFHSVLSNTPSLSARFKLKSEAHFDAISILRNKVSHSDKSLSENDKLKLRRAKFDKAITSDGRLQFTFEFYKLLLKQTIYFFDTINSNL